MLILNKNKIKSLVNNALKKCRYNNKHKFETDEQLLSHEKYCPDKSKRKDLKECPYNPRHIVLTKQYEKHIKTCKRKPKNVPIKEEQRLDENNSLNDNGNKKMDDWDLMVDQWIDETVDNNETITKNEKNKIIIEKLKSTNNQDVFDDDDFIFKNCYI